uniref:HTH cro/C1-type domain-containing protein n=1 Tax=Thermosporothrix sp. COM3 TaxID=2490863 RepID=A0A455SG55_9CHLR|nr:hypothetical protein KTC_21940 [Thermosporothrix sp. COM3]
MDVSSSPRWSTLLKEERIARNWRQKDLAEQLGTSILTIKRWEQGHQQPSAFYRAKLCSLFEKSPLELGFLEEPSVSEKQTTIPATPADQTAEPEKPAPMTHLRLPPVCSKKGAVLVGLLCLLCLLPLAFGLFMVRAAPSRPVTPPPRVWQSWSQLLNDPLEETRHSRAWQVDTNASDPTDAQCGFSTVSQTYQIQAQGLNYCAYGNSLVNPWVDVAYSADVAIHQGDWGGLIVHLRQGDYYYFGIRIDGSYLFMRHQREGGGQDAVLLSGTASTIVQGRDQWNTLLIVAQASVFQLWMNGQYLATASDGVLHQGTVGVAACVGRSDSSPLTQVWVRHALIWRPK